MRSKNRVEPARYSFEGKYKQICDLKKNIQINFNRHFGTVHKIITKHDKKYKHMRSKKRVEPACYPFEGKYKQIWVFFNFRINFNRYFGVLYIHKRIVVKSFKP